jgi:hypothetical protein
LLNVASVFLVRIRLRVSGNHEANIFRLGKLPAL